MSALSLAIFPAMPSASPLSVMSAQERGGRTKTTPTPTPKPATPRQSVAKPSSPKPSRPRSGTIVRNQIGMDLVYVPPGSFMMGSNNGDSDEKPVHEVTIREGFYMGRYEVTQSEWQQVMGNSPSKFNGDNLPVETVSWLDAQGFIQKLNQMNDGYAYRLPTEAEWEYACRARTTGDYAGSLDSMAWYENNSGNQTHPVGQKQANGFGLYDMLGNVYEWCEDWQNYSGASKSVSAQKTRMLRGGSWDSPASRVRSAGRIWNPLDTRSGTWGFRVGDCSVIRWHGISSNE
jgi:formylglycine-generating enzyme required for sulfatase activity